MENRLITIIEEVSKELDLTLGHIQMESNLRDDLGFDSFGLAFLTVKIEDEFGVDIFENAFPKSVGDIVTILKG